MPSDSLSYLLIIMIFKGLYLRHSRVAMTYLVALGFTPMNAKGRKIIVLKKKK
jgi:hypothetical protein